MKKLSIFSIALGMICPMAISQGFSGDTFAKAKQAKAASIVVTYAQTPKFTEIVNGEPKGICFDIMEDFVEYVESTHGIDVNVQYKKISDPTNFQLFLSTIKASNGGVFGLGDVTITEERKQFYEFSPSYFENVAILVTNKASKKLVRLSNIGNDFSSMKAAVQKGSTHDKRLQEMKDQYGGFEIEYVNNSQEKLDKVLSSPDYFTYVDFPNYLEIINDNVNVDRQIPGDIHGESFGFIMPKNSDWAPVMNEFFNANGGYVKSAQYKQVMSDNLGYKILQLLEYFSR